MDIFDAIAQRHSYRGGFRDDPVPREDLQRIVQAGIQAPSGCNAQTTTFVIVDEPDGIAALAEVIGKQVVADAKAVIVCVVHHRPVYQDKSFAVEDCSAAVENMLLAITALGYATVWLDGVLRAEKRAARIAGLLGIPADMEVRVVLPIGVAEEKCEQAPKQPFEKRAWFGRYGGASP